MTPWVRTEEQDVDRWFWLNKLGARRATLPLIERSLDYRLVRTYRCNRYLIAEFESGSNWEVSRWLGMS